MKNKSICGAVLLTSASFAGYNIGSGFATGIEGQQFFAAYGAKYAYIGMLISIALLALVLAPVYIVGYEQQFQDDKTIYRYFCGRKMGAVFDAYVYFSIGLVILTMMSGAGATMKQYLGIPEFAGTVLIGTLCILAALLGLKKLIRVLSYIGVFVIIFIFCCALYVFFTSGETPASGSVNVNKYVADGELLPANIFGISNPIFSAVACAGLLAGSGFPWVSATGKLCSGYKEAILCGVFSSIVYFGAQGIVVYLDLTTMDKIAGAEVPMLAVIQHYLPVLSLIYSCIIVLAIFSTVSGRLFLLASRFDGGSRKKHLAITISAVMISAAAGAFIPFARISNIMFSISGTVGILFCVIIMHKFLKTRKDHMA